MATSSTTYGYNTNSSHNNHWSITRDDGDDYVEVSSSGTATRQTSDYPLGHIIKVTGNATESDDSSHSGTFAVRGGFGWVSAYVTSGNVEEGKSLRATLKVDVVLKKGSTTKVVASATGDAQRDGYLNCWAKSTYASLSYTPTAADRAAYTHLFVRFTCDDHGDSYKKVNRVGSFKNGDSLNPIGSVSIKTRDNINIVYTADGTSTTMTDLTYSENGTATDIRKLSYDGSTIFEDS